MVQTQSSYGDMLLDDYREQQATSKGTLTSIVLAWGKNQDGELGVSANKMSKQPLQSKGFKGVVSFIATARSHTGIVNNEGRMYMAGSLLFGKIGMQSQFNNFREFHLHKLMAEYKIKKVSCGDFHTLALAADGRLFSWGGTLWDKTGHKAVGIHQIQHLNGKQVTDIACGDFHSVALTGNGQVYSWGGGGKDKNKGQLGHSNKKDLPHPQLIAFFNGKKATKIACGDYHTMVLTKDNQLYAFGEGNYGQLGTGVRQDSATPKKVALNFSISVENYFNAGLQRETEIKQIALGGKHSLVLTNDGHIYAFGYGAQGQLGIPVKSNKNDANRYEPTLVQSLINKKVVMVAAGSYHSLCLTDRHDVYCCGSNAKGQLGVSQSESLINWTHVTALSGKRTAKIYAGSDHSWAVLDAQQPQIDDYEPPSPIKVVELKPFRMQQARQSRQATKQKDRDRNQRERQRQLRVPSDKFISQLSTNRKLQLISTEVEVSHRFVHFVFKDKLINSMRSQFEAYIEAVKKAEGPRMKFYKFNQDDQLYDQQGQMTLPRNPRGMTIMMLCLLPAEANQHIVFKGPKNKIPIGELMMLDEAVLKPQGTVPSHNYWFFKFISMFDDELQKARFIELRPKNFCV